MTFCGWLLAHLGTIGLGFDLIGAVLMVGHRFYVSRRVGIWLSPVHRRRMNAFDTLLEDDRIEDDTEGFSEFRELVAPAKFFETQKMFDHHGLDYTHIKREDGQVVVHADETKTASNITSDINVRRNLSEVDDSMGRAFEKTFLNYGIGLLVVGFSLQIIANLLMG